jgi:hypothetical protein
MMLLTVSHGLLFQQLPLLVFASDFSISRRRAGMNQALAPPSWWSPNVVRLPATIWSLLS